MNDTLTSTMQAGTEWRQNLWGCLPSMKFLEVSGVAMTASGHSWDRLGGVEPQDTAPAHSGTAAGESSMLLSLSTAKQISFNAVLAV